MSAVCSGISKYPVFDGMTRHTEEAYRWVESFDERRFRDVIRERDAPWEDYGERPH